MVSNDNVQGNTGEFAPNFNILNIVDLLEAEREKEKADDVIRRDPALRLAMVELVGQVTDLIADAAEKLAAKKGYTSPDSSDDLYGLLAWQLTEFFAQADQLDEKGAMEWFEVDSLPPTAGVIVTCR
jgi:hypothetical protein